ncbi:MAG: hypothetical protein GY867_08020 [bacterium]|nr:hypothetical protein [bacterium]
MQKTLVVIVPPGVNPGTVDLTVENSIGVSFGYALNVTNIGNLSVPALGSGAAYQLAHTFGVATRDFFVAFDNLAAATPELQAQELPNMDSVNVWLDAYFAYIDTASPGMLAQIDSIILEGDVDVIGQTYECIDSLRYSYGVPTFHDRRTGIVLIVVLIALAAVIVYRRRGAVVK